MIMTAPHIAMLLHQNPTTIAYATGAIGVCRYIALVTDCTVYNSWLISVKLSIIHTTKFSTEVVLSNVSITHFIFYKFV